MGPVSPAWLALAALTPVDGFQQLASLDRADEFFDSGFSFGHWSMVLSARSLKRPNGSQKSCQGRVVQQGVGLALDPLTR